MDIGFDGDHRLSKPISANEAFELASKKKHKKDTNYELTIQRLYKMIETNAEQGFDSMEYTCPRFVLDGSLADPIVLARKIKKKLESLGYAVERNGEKLNISWIPPSQ